MGRIQGILYDIYCNLFESFRITNQVSREWLVGIMSWDEVKNRSELLYLPFFRHLLENVRFISRSDLILKLGDELKIHILHGSFGLHYIIDFI